jgi:hypothetical protein
MSTLLDRFGDIFSVIMSPLWNHPERMKSLSRFLMRLFCSNDGGWNFGVAESAPCIRAEANSN